MEERSGASNAARTHEVWVNEPCRSISTQSSKNVRTTYRIFRDSMHDFLPKAIAPSNQETFSLCPSPHSIRLSLPRAHRQWTPRCFDIAIEANISSCFTGLAICIEPIHEAPSALRRDCICRWKTPGSSDSFNQVSYPLMQPTRWASSRATCAACIRTVHASK